MEIAIARMDDKSRIVIPKRLRERVGVIQRSCFIVYAMKGMIYLKIADPESCGLSDSLGIGSILEGAKDV